LLAGNDKNISHNPIIVKIFLPNVPNLTLVDLPGITQVACKDKGQPEDIKEQIEKLIGSYIKSEETIILSIIPARTDVEADVGVGLVKKYDPDFNRSIGVLTKVDLMNVDTDVSSYVSGNISKNLRMNYGYYLVRNRTNKEMNEITMHDGFKKEQAFFQNHSVYSKMSDNDKKKMGTNNLRDKLVTILSNKIKELLPMISKQIVQKYTDTCKELIQLGSEIPQDQLSRQTYVHHLILNLSQVFIQAIDGMDKDNYNIGRHLKDNYIAYRDIINKLDPITEFDAKYIDNISKNVEGNHMSFLVPSISVFEACIRDEKYKPVQKMLHPSIECIRFTSKQLSTLVTELLNSPNSEIHRYPKLIAYLEYKIISNIIIPYEDKTNEFVRELIDMEESYVWTDSDQFKHNVSEMLKTKAIFDNTTIKTLLTIYYNTVKDNIKNNVPKAIMLHLVLRLKKNLLNELMTKIDNNEICNLLEENTEIGLRRTQLSEWKEKLTIAKKKLGL
jgi:dynamin 1-like protein